MLRTSFFILSITFLVTLIGYFWIDQPLVFLMYHFSSAHQVLTHNIPRIPEVFIFFAAIYYVYYILRYSYGYVTWLENNFLIATNALVIAYLFKNCLKICFGRTWALSWFGNNPSLVRDHVYGFFWFQGGNQAYASFPSGHMAVATAVITVFWLCYPKLRVVWFLFAVIVACGLIGMNFHFFSDVVAGAGLGCLIGYWTYNISNQIPSK